MMSPDRRSIRRLRILLVAPSLESLSGGQEVQAELLLRAWKDDSVVDVELLLSNPRLPRALRSLERVPLLRTLARFPIRVLALYRFGQRANVIHAFSGAGTSFLIATLPVVAVAKLLKKAIVVHYHSGLGATHLAHSAVARHTLRACDRVVVPSSYLHAPFEARGILTTTIANVVDSSRFTLRESPPTTPTLVSVRNFERIYGVDDVIRTFARLKVTRPTLRLLLAGSGPKEKELRALVRSLELDDVSFVGRLSRDDIAELMKRASVLVNASRVDNMPVSLLEAFAAGVPVVSTSAGGIPTFAKHNETALLADVGDVAALAIMVGRLLDDAQLAKRLVRAAQREVGRCSWVAIRPRWISLYRDVLGRFESAR